MTCNNSINSQQKQLRIYFNKFFNYHKDLSKSEENIIIYKNFCINEDNEFYFDLDFNIEVCSNNESFNFMTVDSMNLSLRESLATFKEIRLMGEGCKGGALMITPDRKEANINFPNFYTSTNEVNCTIEGCKIRLIFDEEEVKTNKKIILNIKIMGQAALEESCGSLYEGFSRFFTIKGPYANNYEAKLTIEASLKHCNHNN